MRHTIKLLAFSICFLSFMSCMSTREYMKTQTQLFEDGELVAEEYSLRRDGKVLESSASAFYDLSEKFIYTAEDDTETTMDTFIALREQSSKSSNEQVTFTLWEYTKSKTGGGVNSSQLGKKTVRVKDGKLSAYTDSSGKKIKAKGDKYSAELEKFFSDNLDDMIDFIYKGDGSDSAATNRQSVSTTEKVTVESVPNGSYITYSIIGKPFVVAGVTAWNVVKCAGYALINFAGGYNTATGSSSGRLWMLPSYKKSKEKAETAKEANKIPYYPEYHMPFTNNHIIVEKFDRDISVLSLADENAEEIVPIERYEYDNTMSVERSASADAASTAAVAGLIGTGVTIPVSVVTWVGGAAAGIYIDIMGSKN